MTTKYANEKGGLGREPSVPSSKSKKELLLELLALENDHLGEVGEPDITTKQPHKSTILSDIAKPDSIDDNEPITKPKKTLTEKQIEALKKGQQKRDENRERNKAEKLKKEEDDKRKLEEKLVKKAIAVKKKQIKKQALLDEISDDEEKPIPQGRRSDGSPLEKPKIASRSEAQSPLAVPLPQGPKIMFV